MRKLVTTAILMFALSLGAVSTVGAAGPVARTTGAGRAVVAASHTWKASTTGTFRATARIVLTATYSSGKFSGTVTGVKKGDKLHIWIAARKGTATPVTIVSIHVTVSTTTGKVTFSTPLTLAQAHLIRADVKAGDTLRLHVRDGVKGLAANFVKA